MKMSGSPYVVTFYSFKGGVGRSMALLNAAYALALRGRNVLILDVDLEAPGISGSLVRSGELNGPSAKDIVDLLGWAVRYARSFPEGELDRELLLDASPSFAEHLAWVKQEQIPNPGRAGQVHVIGADLDRDYIGRLQALELGGLSGAELIRTGHVLRTYIRAQTVEKNVPSYYGQEATLQVPYDYILIDSRTGITEAGGLCIGPLSDRLVVLTALNDQNIEGTRKFLDSVGIDRPGAPHQEPWDVNDVPPSSPFAPPRLGPKPTLIVASPVPHGTIALTKERLAKLTQRLGHAAARISYHPQMALFESIFVRDYPEEYLTLDYLHLVDQIMATVGEHPRQVVQQIDALLDAKETPSNQKIVSHLAATIHVAAQDPTLGAFLLKRLVPAFPPTADEVFCALDQGYRCLSQSQSPDSWVIFLQWGALLNDWANATPDAENKLRELRYQEARSVLQRGVDAAPVDQQSRTPAEKKASALIFSGIMKGNAYDWKGSRADLDAVLTLLDVSDAQHAAALVNRGVLKDRSGDWDGALDDYDDALAYDKYLNRLPAMIKASAWFNRGIILQARNKRDEALEAYAKVLGIGQAPAAVRAGALLNRGVLRLEDGDRKAAQADYEEILDLPEILPNQWARATENLKNLEHDRKVNLDIQATMSVIPEALRGLKLSSTLVTRTATGVEATHFLDNAQAQP